MSAVEGPAPALGAANTVPVGPALPVEAGLGRWALAAEVWRCNEVARCRRRVMGAGTPWGMSSGRVGCPWGGTAPGLAVGMGVWSLAVVGKVGLC